jgi:hypothetical protein
MSDKREPSPGMPVVAIVVAEHAVHAIDQQDERQIEAMLAVFLYAGWPTVLAQNQ